MKLRSLLYVVGLLYNDECQCFLQEIFIYFSFQSPMGPSVFMIVNVKNLAFMCMQDEKAPTFS